MGYYVLLIVAIILCIILFLARQSRLNKNKDAEVELNEFDRHKMTMQGSCSADDFEKFFSFLQEYEGGYLHRSEDSVTRRSYLGKEKEDLKEIFFNVIMPSPNISSKRKEDFRLYLVKNEVIED